MNLWPDQEVPGPYLEAIGGEGASEKIQFPIPPVQNFPEPF